MITRGRCVSIFYYSAWIKFKGKIGMTLDKFYEQLGEDIFESYDKQNEDLQTETSDTVVELLHFIDQERIKAKGLNK